ncbi:KaiC domain-containing protein [Candidatus Geothermarchaeota archaeon ex4572_27]|nr:MAG: KaiC domain-containing protein [Candidatus Geothermarchaeota archaeon ex4572_27]
MEAHVERVSTGVPRLDEMLCGGIPRGFVVAVTGEPGTGKTVLCIHFIARGVEEGDKCIYVTTEESRESIIKQAAQFGFDFKRALLDRRLVIIDALMRPGGEPWSLQSLSPEELVNKVIEAKRYLGYGEGRLVVDSMSAFWLDAPAMARKYSYYVKRVLSQWGFTMLLTSQYAITTSEAFGFGVEHVSDGIIRFRRMVRGGRLRRFLIVEKMRQTPHDLRLYEIDIRDGEGLVVLGPVEMRREDVALPWSVYRRVLEAKREELLEEGP